MRLAEPLTKLIAVVVLALWLAPSVGAQGQPPAKAEAAPKPAKTAEKPKKEKPKKAVEAAKPTGAAAETKAPGRRDPFEPLVAKERPGIPDHLPAGKAGLVVGTLRVDGIVRGPSGMIAVVSNPQQRVYFLREGDKLYNGSVERITMDGVSFRESGMDAFGKPLERQVVKRLYPSAGES